MEREDGCFAASNVELNCASRAVVNLPGYNLDDGERRVKGGFEGFVNEHLELEPRNLPDRLIGLGVDQNALVWLAAVQLAQDVLLGVGGQRVLVAGLDSR